MIVPVTCLVLAALLFILAVVLLGTVWDEAGYTAVLAIAFVFTVVGLVSLWSTGCIA